MFLFQKIQQSLGLEFKNLFFEVEEKGLRRFIQKALAELGSCCRAALVRRGRFVSIFFVLMKDLYLCECLCAVLLRSSFTQNIPRQDFGCINSIMCKILLMSLSHPIVPSTSSFLAAWTSFPKDSIVFVLPPGEVQYRSGSELDHPA